MRVGLTLPCLNHAGSRGKNMPLPVTDRRSANPAPKDGQGHPNLPSGEPPGLSQRLSGFRVPSEAHLP